MATKTTLRIEDECLVPYPKLTINYTGPNPFRVCKEIRMIMIKIFEIEPKDVWERDFRWDISTEPHAFFVRVYADKPLDVRTSIFAEVTIQGVQPSDPKKDGKVTILIGGKLRTLYPLDSAFKRSPIYSGITRLGGLAEVGGLLWLYHRIFYEDIRRDYIKYQCNRRLETLWRELRTILEIPIPGRVL
jgi:hypothetical protein